MFRTLLNQRRDGEGYREMVRASSDLSVGDGWPGVDWRGALLGGGWERCIWEGKRAGVDMKEPVLGAGLAGAERCRHGACVLACLDWEELRRKLLTVFNTLIDVRLPEKLAATVYYSQRLLAAAAQYTYILTELCYTIAFTVLNFIRRLLHCIALVQKLNVLVLSTYISLNTTFNFSVLFISPPDGQITNIK
jgi:hypothetical protein